MRIRQIINEMYKTVPIKDPITGKTVWVNKGPDGRRVPGVYNSAKDAEDALKTNKKNPQQPKDDKPKLPKAPKEKPTSNKLPSSKSKDVKPKFVRRLLNKLPFGTILASGITYYELSVALTDLQNALIKNGCDFSNPNVQKEKDKVKAVIQLSFTNFITYAPVPAIMSGLAMIPFLGWIAAGVFAGAMAAYGSDINNWLIKKVNEIGLLSAMSEYSQNFLTSEMIKDLLTTGIPYGAGAIPLTRKPPEGQSPCTKKELNQAYQFTNNELEKSKDDIKSAAMKLQKEFKSMVV